jgi:hypothetical protein
MPLVYRLVKGTPLTFDEMDGNLTYLNSIVNTQISGNINYVPIFSTTSSITSSVMYQALGNMFISGGLDIKGNNIITGSLLVTGSTVLTGTVSVSGSLFISSSAQTVGQFVGNNNGFVEFSVRNISTGISASGDIAVYADNGTPTSSFIDIGINNSGVTPGFSFGRANDSYVYNTGGNLFIGNNTAFNQPSIQSQSLHLFANSAGTPDLTITGSRVGIQKSGSLNATLDISGSTIITGSLSQGQSVIASGIFSHAQGQSTIASGSYSHAEGNLTTSSGSYSHAEGEVTIASGYASHAEGNNTRASKEYSHAEGYNTIASGYASHAEGQDTIATGSNSHAEGIDTLAQGAYSHAEGIGTIASGLNSHAEGYYTTASGDYSHAEGQFTRATGQSSHAEGFTTVAASSFSHAEGNNTVASGFYQHVQGAYNISSSTANAFILGNGTSNANRSNLIFAAGTSVEITGSFTVTSGSGTEFQVLNTGVRIGNVATDSHTITGSLNITGSVTIDNILTIVPTGSLPTVGIASGSFMTSGSGANLKPYFWNGATWTALF